MTRDEIVEHLKHDSEKIRPLEPVGFRAPAEIVEEAARLEKTLKIRPSVFYRTLLEIGFKAYNGS